MWNFSVFLVENPKGMTRRFSYWIIICSDLNIGITPILLPYTFQESMLYYFIKCFPGTGRWISTEEQCLHLQGTWVRFPVPAWQLTVAYKSRFRKPKALSWPSGTSGMHVVHRCTRRQKTHTHKMTFLKQNISLVLFREDLRQTLMMQQGTANWAVGK